jgi:hypothetical protein
MKHFKGGRKLYILGTSAMAENELQQHRVYTNFHTNRLTNSVAPEPEGPSPCSQEPATGPYPEPSESTLHPQPISLRSNLIPSSYLRLGLRSGLFPLDFTTKTLYISLSSPMRATRSVHLILLDLICLMI